MRFHTKFPRVTTDVLCIFWTLLSSQMLHQLTARAIIRDWTEGSLDFDRMEHEVIFFLVGGSCRPSVFTPLLQFVGRLLKETPSPSSSTPASTTPSSLSSPASSP